jgi:hypothetical protein
MSVPIAVTKQRFFVWEGDFRRSPTYDQLVSSGRDVDDKSHITYFESKISTSTPETLKCGPGCVCVRRPYHNSCCDGCSHSECGQPGEPVNGLYKAHLQQTILQRRRDKICSVRKTDNGHASESPVTTIPNGISASESTTDCCSNGFAGETSTLTLSRLWPCNNLSKRLV